MKKNNNLKEQENKESKNKSNIVQDIYTIYLKLISDNIKSLQKYYNSHLTSKEKEKTKEKINLYFSQISSIIILLSEEKDKIISKYNSILKCTEQKIRILYSDLFNLKIKNNYLENNLDILLKKEKEYKLVKEKTGVVIENGKIIYNNRKENEIYILREENSNLKNAIMKNEKELLEIKEQLKIEKDNYNKQLASLNNKVNQLKCKLKNSNTKLKVKSISSINIKTNDITNSKLKLNFTANNSSFKGNNSNGLSNGINNSNNNEFSNNKNYSNKRKYESILINKNNSVKNKSIANSERTTNIKSHYKSSGHLNLKNKIINKLKKNTQDESKNKQLSLSNLNVSPIHSKKILCLTPNNNNNNNAYLNFQSFQKISDIKNKKNPKLKSCLNNQKFYKSNNFNEMKIMSKKINSNNIINKKNKRKQMKKELTWSQNLLINNSSIPKNSKINRVNKIIINNKSFKKINKTNIGASPILENSKNKRKLAILGKDNVFEKSLNLNSIKRKNNTITKNIFNSFYG